MVNVKQSVSQKRKILVLISSNQWRNKAKGSFEYVETNKEKLSGEEISSRVWEIESI